MRRLQLRFFKAARFCNDKAGAAIHPSLKIKQHGLLLQVMKGPCTAKTGKEIGDVGIYWLATFLPRAN